MVVMGHLVDLETGIAYTNRNDPRTVPSERLKRPVIEPAAVAEAIPLRIERHHGHEEKTGYHWHPVGWRNRYVPGTGFKRVTRCPCAEGQRPVHCDHYRHTDRKAPFMGILGQGKHVEFRLHWKVGRYGHIFGKTDRLQEVIARPFTGIAKRCVKRLPQFKATRAKKSLLIHLRRHHPDRRPSYIPPWPAFAGGRRDNEGTPPPGTAPGLCTLAPGIYVANLPDRHPPPLPYRTEDARTEPISRYTGRYQKRSIGEAEDFSTTVTMPSGVF